MENSVVIQIKTDLLQPNPLQVRDRINPSSINELVESIREHGILEPLLVAKTPAGYQIISGERRWQAAKVLGLEKVPAVVKQTDSQGMLQMALVNNVQRSELNPLERAKAFQRLKEEFGVSWSETARKIGKSVAYVVNSVNLLKLPDALKDGLLSGLITEGHARALGGIEGTRLMIEGYKTVLKEKASVRRAEEIARLMRESEREEEGGKKGGVFNKEEIGQLVSKVKAAFLPLPVDVEVIHTRVRGKVSLEFRAGSSQTRKFLKKISKKLARKKNQ